MRLAQELILGKDNPRVKQGSVCGIQAVSGTGALRVLCEVISEWLPGTKATNQSGRLLSV